MPTKPGTACPAHAGGFAISITFLLYQTLNKPYRRNQTPGSNVQVVVVLYKNLQLI
jgi:hypothetical protein